MWYFVWVVGIATACGFGIFNALRLERYEANNHSQNSNHSQNND